ncbi:hypothetical protein D9M72_598050 [compost metagenome]
MKRNGNSNYLDSNRCCLSAVPPAGALACDTGSFQLGVYRYHPVHHLDHQWNIFHRHHGVYGGSGDALSSQGGCQGGLST